MNVIGIVSGLIAFGLVWAILSHRVRDGIVVKVGLISMTAGFGSASLHLLDGRAEGFGNSIVLIEAGMIVACAGIIWRGLRKGKS
jgi:hypothetical protein